MLKIEHLMVKKHHNIILKDVNLEVKEGTFVVLCGDSKSGNTAIIECIAGICDYQKGRILWKDQKVRKQDVFYAAQATCLFKEQTIGEYGIFLSQFYSTFSLKDYDSFIQFFGLHRKQRIFFLQDEEKQIVEIIAAFSTHCPLLMLDRVVTVCSMKKQEKLWIKLLQTWKPTILLAVEDRKGVAGFADIVYEMKDGMFLEKASSDVTAGENHIVTDEPIEKTLEEVSEDSDKESIRERLFDEKGWDEDETDW